MDPAGRRGAGARGDPGRVEQVLAEVSPRDRQDVDYADRHDDRGAAGRADRRPDRRGRRVLLVRHQRPHPDGLGLLPRRRRGGVLLRYLEQGIFGVSPFESLDRDGVGRLVRIAAEEGRAAAARTSSSASAASTAATPDSVHFFHEVGLDYVSCSPFRVPVARLEAGRAAVESAGSDSR